MSSAQAHWVDPYYSSATKRIVNTQLAIAGL